MGHFIFTFLTTFSPGKSIYFMFLPNFVTSNLDRGLSLWIRDSESSLSFCSSAFIDFHIMSVFLGAFSSTTMRIFLTLKGLYKCLAQTEWLRTGT